MLNYVDVTQIIDVTDFNFSMKLRMSIYSTTDSHYGNLLSCFRFKTFSCSENEAIVPPKRRPSLRRLYAL